MDAASVAGADWLIALTRVQAALLRQRLSDAWPGRIGLLGAPGRDWRRDGPMPAVPRDEDPDVADPWRQEQAAYLRTLERIDGLLVGWSGVFRSLAKERGCQN